MKQVLVKMPDKTRKKFSLVPAARHHPSIYSCEECFFSKDKCTLPSRNKPLCLPTTNKECIGYIYRESEERI